MSSTPGTRSYLCFDLDGARYGIDTTQIAEVGRPLEVTAVPGAPDFVVGVGGYRGRIVPIIDTGLRLELDRTGERARTRSIFVSSEAGWTGLLVDDVVEILDIGEDAIDPAPGVMDSGNTDFYEGIARTGAELVGLLNIPEVTSFEVDAATLEERGGARGSNGSPKPQPSAEEEEQRGTGYAVFRVRDEEYAVESEAVTEVIPLTEPERPGRLPKYVLGLIAHRGASVPVIDLYARVHPGNGVREAAGSLAMLNTAQGRFGMAVDSVVELLPLPDEQLLPAPDIISGGGEHIRALVVQPESDRVFVVLDKDRLILPEHVKKLQKMGGDVMGDSDKGTGASGAGYREFVLFSAGGTRFALPSSTVREILRTPDVTWVPYAPEWVRGVFQLRGEVLPVVDLNARLKLGTAAPEGDGKLVVASRDSANGAEHFGLLVDKLSEIRQVPEDALADPPEVVQKVNARFLSKVFAVEDRTVLVLDPNALADRSLEQAPKPRKTGRRRAAKTTPDNGAGEGGTKD